MLQQCLACVLLVLPLLVRGEPIPLKNNEGFLDSTEHGLLRKFQDFSRTFSKSYGSPEEYEKRYAIFKDNLKEIDRFNQEERGTARYGITRFTDLTYDEFLQYYTGARISEEEWKRYADPMELGPEPEIEFSNRNKTHDIRVVGGKVFLPKKFDYRKKKAVTPVKDQGRCGSCWAFSTIANIEGVWAKNKGQLLDLSEQELVDCDNIDHGCHGGMMDNAVAELIRLGGVAKTSDYPYEAKRGECRFNANKAAVKIAGNTIIPANEKKMAMALVEHGPLSVAIHAPKKFAFYKSGVYDPSPSECSHNPDFVNHAVTLVGYDEELKAGQKKKKMPFWFVKNSWGRDWGEQGYIRMSRGKNTCSISAFASTVYL